MPRGLTARSVERKKFRMPKPNPLSPAIPPVDAAPRILAAAEELFAAQGYDAVSMNTIAARAGVSKANVFHHYGSKNALYLAVLRAACRDSGEQLQQLMRDSGPVPERLAEFANSQLGNMLTHAKVSTLVLRELLKDGERRGRELAEKVFGDNFARLVALVRAGQNRAELRADIDPAMAAVVLIGANVFFFQTQEVLRHLPDVDFARDPRRYSTMLSNILLHGIVAAPPPSATSHLK